MSSDPPPLSDFDELEDADGVEFSSKSPSVECWRCGKFFAEESQNCPYCRARNKMPAASANGTEAPCTRGANRKPSPLVVTLFGYGILLATSIGMFLGMLATSDMAADGDDWQQLGWIITVEIIDTAIIAWLLLRIGRPPAGEPISASRRAAAWAFGLAGLVAVLGLNFGYHSVLQAYLQLRPDQMLGIRNLPSARDRGRGVFPPPVVRLAPYDHGRSCRRLG